MKKFVSLFLATSMALSVPAFADTNSKNSAEIYAHKAEALFGVSGSNYNFNSNDDDPNTDYTLNWEKQSVSFDSDGNVVYFSNWAENTDSNKTVINKDKAVEIANATLKKVLDKNADSMKLESCDFDDDTWVVTYHQYNGSTKLVYNGATVKLDKFGGLTYYACDNKFSDKNNNNASDFFAQKAKALFGISDSKFTYEYDKDGSAIIYTLNFEKQSVAFNADGDVIYFSNWAENTDNKTTVNKDKAIEIANATLKKVLDKNADSMKLESCDFDDDTWVVTYHQYNDNTKLAYNDATVKLDKFGGLTYYACTNNFSDKSNRNSSDFFAQKAKALFGVSSKFAFEHDEDSSDPVYTLNFEKQSVSFNADGDVIYFSNWAENTDNNKTVIDKDKAVEIANATLKKVLDKNADSMKLDNCDFSNDAWVVTYHQYNNNTKLAYNGATIKLNKFGGLTYYSADNNADKKDDSKVSSDFFAQKAKALFGISDSNFTYVYDKGSADPTYTLNWEKQSVSFNTDGNVVYFSNWAENTDSNKTVITKDKAEEIANAVLKKVLDKNADSMKLESCEWNYDLWDIDYYQYIGDYKAEYNKSCIQLDKYGNLKYYTGNNKFDVTVTKADNILDYEATKKAFIEGDYFGKALLSAYENSSSKYYLFPCFTVKSNYLPYISATDGKKAATSVYSHNSASLFKEGLSAAEERTVANMNEVLSADKVVKIIKDTFDYDFDTNSLQTKFYSQNNKSYTSVYDTLSNAATVSSDGKITYFSEYGKPINKNTVLSKDELKEKALQYVTSLGYDSYKIYDTVSSSESVSYNLYSCIDDVVNYSDSITIDLNIDGSVSYFNVFHFDDIAVPKFESKLSVEEAFDKCADIFGFTLKYVLDDNNKAILVYSFDKVPYLSTEGNAITANNTSYKAENSSYADIDGCPQKEYIEKIAKVGLYFDTPEFSPNSVLTFGDFKNLCDKCTFIDFYGNYSFADEYQLTKYDIAKLFCDNLQLSGLCENSSNFKSNFSDVNGKNLPYVALCESLGIFNGGSEFNGTSTVTRGEVAEMLYNFLKASAKYIGQDYINID